MTMDDDLQAFEQINVDLESIAKDVFLPLSNQVDCEQILMDPLYPDPPFHSVLEELTSSDSSPICLLQDDHDMYTSSDIYNIQSETYGIGLNSSPYSNELLQSESESAINNHCPSKQNFEKRKRKQNLTLRTNDQLEFVEVMTGNSREVRETTRSPLQNVKNTLERDSHSSPLVCEFNKSHLKSDLLTIDMINRRKESIASKMAVGAQPPMTCIQFTEMEEYDIMQRAALFLGSMKPDKEFCLAPGEKRPDEVVPATLSFMDSAIYEYHTEGLYQLQRPPTPQPIYTIDEGSYILYKENKCRVPLPLGTQLVKPGRKLVELVAIAIDGSPDGLLQVQQVYTYLMLKYPYFAFMDKLTTSSWRSSIRHALYQKWFKKIAVCNEKIGNKGCFWAINRENTPKEWTLPTSSSPVKCTSNWQQMKWTACSPVAQKKQEMIPVRAPLSDFQRFQGIAELNNCSTKIVDHHIERPPQQIWQPQARYRKYCKPTRMKGPYNFQPLPPSSIGLNQLSPYCTSRPPVATMAHMRHSVTFRIPPPTAFPYFNQTSSLKWSTTTAVTSTVTAPSNAVSISLQQQVSSPQVSAPNHPVTHYINK